MKRIAMKAPTTGVQIATNLLAFNGAAVDPAFAFVAAVVATAAVAAGGAAFVAGLVAGLVVGFASPVEA